MAEHKHAAVLRAIADGKAVQWRSNERWHDYQDGSHGNPLYCSDITEWRIKPEPKPDVVRYVNAYLGDGHRTIETAKKAQSEDIAGRVKIVIDGETGKLKSAEVLP